MVEMKIGKHWLCYTPVWFITIISIMLLIFGNGNVYLFGWILLGFNILGYFTIKSYKWIAKDGEILIESGVLPWQKSYIRIPVARVLGMTVDRGGFFGWFLNYGTITLNALDGSSSPIIGKHMKGAVAFMEHITGGDHPDRSDIRNDSAEILSVPVPNVNKN